MKQQYLEAGRIVNTFGVRGEVKLEPWCDGADFLRRFKTLYIDGAPLAVLSCRAHKGCVLLRFAGAEDLNAAMALKGKLVYFDRNDAQLPAGHFFLSDLVGARVLDESNREVGTLAEVQETPAGHVYIVRGGTGEHSIPAVPEFILETDAEAGVLRVHMIEGM